MKVICNGKELADAVAKATKALPARTINPILDGMKLTATDGTLLITATDLELSIENTITAETLEEGEAVVPGKFFSDFVKRIGERRVELLTAGNKMKISYGSDGQSETACMDPESYPQITKLSEGQYFEMARNEFKDLVNKVSFAVSTDDSYPTLKSVCLEVGEAEIEGVALDGYRLAKSVKPLLQTTARFNILVPSRGITEISRLLDDSEDPVRLYVQRNFLMAQIDGTTIVTRLLDGNFVNYNQIIPKQFSSTVTVAKGIFAEVLGRAELFASSELSYLVQFDIREDSIKITSEGQNGVFGETVPAHLDGMEMTIKFNSKYFSDILRSIDGETVQIKLIAPDSPCVITPTGTENCLYLVLPVKGGR